MVTATSEGSQAPARQGHFVVTAELPEIQTVTVWTPCCAPMGTLYNKETEWIASVAVCLKTVRISRVKISDGTIPGMVRYLLYIATYMYNLMLYPAKNVWWE